MPFQALGLFFDLMQNKRRIYNIRKKSHFIHIAVDSWMYVSGEMFKN